ncbi:MAG TPA: transketolase C-terminal domain-containing protein, partial [Candidatus Limnocylindrales bacterium]|nr:transketolase C-terminal domain-containing protein [Candidatus Limnocylindrales bacterium]
LYLKESELEALNQRLQAKLRTIEQNEKRWEEVQTEDAEYLLVAYGTVGRTCKTVLREARTQGIRAGLYRPISLWPFPSEALHELAQRVRAILVVELSAGQMVEDVRLAVEGVTPVAFHGRMGGMVPSPGAVLDQLRELWAITEPVPSDGGAMPRPRRPRRAHPVPATRPATRRTAAALLDELVDVDIADALTEVWR